MKKKVLVYMFNLAGGGAERTIVNLINNINKDLFEIVLVMGSDSNNDYLPLVKGTKRIFLHCKRQRQIIPALSRTIRKEKPDLVFTTLNVNNISLLISKLISLEKVPAIIREANNRTESGTVSKINRLITYITYNFLANKIVSLSEGVKSDLIENFNISEKKIEVIYNPVDTSYINMLKNEDTNDVKIEKDEKIILAVGKLGEQKDYPTLLKAFTLVQKQIKSKLIILGKGAEENGLKSLAGKLGIEKQVKFLGFRDNPYKYMNMANLFVLSSKWEGFGHVIVEAMAVGVPVIASNCKSGPSEIIENNKYGMLFDVEDYNGLANNIFEVLSNDSERKKYIDLGHERSQDFDVKHIVTKYEELFSEIIKK